MAYSWTGKELHAVEAHGADIAELPLDVREGRPRGVQVIVAAREAADVELVDDEVLDRGVSNGAQVRR